MTHQGHLQRLIYLFVLLSFSLPVTGMPHSLPDDETWTPLFNGEDLNNWVKRNGEATYHIEGEMIVGTSTINTPNTFLCTKETYQDFILEYEFMVDHRLNSGVQIRSESYDAYRDGRVHGYQVEIDPSDRAWTGGIYDEARRGWLYSLARNQPARAAFKQGQWNHIRVEAIGTTIRTWINGVMAANLVDGMTNEGFIALQVHGIGNDESRAGTTVKWKNIRIKTADLDAESWHSAPDVPVFNYIPNTLTDYEVRKGWRLLWDGETTTGWRGAQSDTFPETGWAIEDGVLHVVDTGENEDARGGDIVTMDTFSSFELELDFRIPEGANSGIKYFVAPDPGEEGGASIGLEYQILDDRGYTRAGNTLDPFHTLGSLYDLIPAGNMTIPGRNKRYNGANSWNRVRILVQGNHVEHWLNNEKVLEFQRDSPTYRALVAKSKFADWPLFGEAAEGRILLQEHGDVVHFRNIKIREF